MPNPKSGTVTFDVARRCGTEGREGRLPGRQDRPLHAGVGKASFGKEKLRENFLAFFEAIVKAKPAGPRGRTSEP